MPRTQGRAIRSVLLTILLGASSTAARAQNIDPANDGSRYAWGENVGWINFQPSFGPGVTVTAGAVTGLAWGENIGWINLSPTAGGGVVNDGAGHLSGFAWGENVGWINFAPTGGGVSIDACGEFDGTAWGENIGWISFRSSGASPFKITTSWVPSVDATGPVTSATGSGSEWSQTDVNVTLAATDCGTGMREVHYTLDSDPEVVTPGSGVTVNITSEGIHSFSYFSVDNTGNTEPLNVLTIRIDKTAPVVTLTSPANGAAYFINQSVAADFAAADSVSGLAGLVSTVAAGSPVATSTLGAKTFSVTATDQAGNSASVTHTYSVVLPPPPRPGIITTFAGGGTVYGDGGPATAATLNAPQGVAIDTAGNVFVADISDFVVRRIDGVTHIITTFAGNGVFGDCLGTGHFGLCGDGGPATSAMLSTPTGVAVDQAGNLYIADTLNSVIRKVDVATGVIDTVAGGAFPGVGFDGDGGPATSALLFWPTGVAVDAAGNIYIADEANYRVRKVDAASGIIETIAGSKAATIANGGSSGDGGPALLASFASVERLALDGAGNVYVLDLHGDEQGNHARIRRIDVTTGLITTVAGGGTGTGESGPATEADLVGHAIGDLALDSAGNLYIAGELRVWLVDVAGNISVFAGTGVAGFSGDGGPATAARFGVLGGIGVAGNGDVYISDGYSPGRVRRVATDAGPDTTPPVISGVPGGIVAEAATPAGAIVAYTPPTALDDRDGTVAVTCAPGSGTVFPVGTTTVACTAADAAGNSSIATFAVTVILNLAPVANAGPDQTVEATSAAGAPVVLDGSTSIDPEGSTLTFTWTGPFGTASGASPIVTLPIGTSTVSLTIDDGDATATDTVAITVRDTTPPAFMFVPANLSADATSVAGAVVTYPPAIATDLVDLSPAVACAPPSGSAFPIGVTTVTCTATDDSGNANSASLTVTVINVNHDPIAAPDSATIDEDAGISTIDVLANDSDVDGDPLTITSASAPSHGTGAIAAGGITYTPAPQYFGSDSFSYTISDGRGAEATGHVDVTVNSVNDSPVADAKTITTAEDAEATITLTGGDADGDPLTFSVATAPSHGVLGQPRPMGQLLRTIPNPAPDASDQFGYSVAGVGGNVVVGAPYDNPGGMADAGSAYLVNATTGAVLLTIPNPAPAVGDHFGSSVAGAGGNILVGVLADDPGGVTDAGSVYLFDGTTGALRLSIPNPVPDIGDLFGLSVASVGGNILAGAPQDDSGGVTDAGSVYLFDGTTGALLLTIPNPAPAFDAGFGTSVASVEGKILVGARRNTSSQGSVYLFDGTGALLLTIPNPAPSFFDRFGISLAAVGGNFLVGAPGESNEGAVYLFDGTTGALLLTIPSPTPPGGVHDEFGAAVASVGGNILVGAPYAGDGFFSPQGLPTDGGGLAYLFDVTTGALLRTIANPAPAPGDVLGSSIAVLGANILVGAPGDDPSGGAALLFDSTKGPSTLIYRPDTNFNGSDSFVVRANDGRVDSGVATVAVSVTPVNDLPSAHDQTVITTEDQPVAITLSGNDVETTDFTWTVRPVGHGVRTGTAPNLIYTPAAHYTGPDQFTFTVTDGGDPDDCGSPSPTCGAALTDVGTVSITVLPDADSDRVADSIDNCPAVANPSQSDVDSDGIGDACDSDNDNDGFTDVDEIAAGSDPLNAASTPDVCDGVDNDLDGRIDEGSTDTDGDGVADCVDPDDDGDGIADPIDRNKTTERDESLAFSSDFNDGLTSGTVASRGGWDVTLTDIDPGGVRAGIRGAGTRARIAACDPSGPEQLTFDAAGETAIVTCGIAGSLTVIVEASPDTVQLRKPLTGRGTQVSLTGGQTATMGSPVTADPANTEPILVEFVDAEDVAHGFFQLDPGESVDVSLTDPEEGIYRVTVLSGTITLNLLDQSTPLNEGQSQDIAPFNTPPTAHAGADQALEATGASGAAVTLDGSGSLDGDGDVLTFSWTGPFGTAIGANPVVTLAIGTNTAMLTVSDGKASATDIVTITVRDTTPPAIACPAAVTAVATSPAGAVVDYPAATASDAVDAAPVVTYSQASGTLFPIGTTTVTVTATDASGNSSACSFTVTVTPLAPLGADLSLTNTDSPDPVTLGSPLTYTVTLRNDGPSPATDVWVGHTLLGYVRLVSATASQGHCFGIAGLVVCNPGTLANRASATVTIVVIPKARGNLTSTAYVWSPVTDPDPADNQASTTTRVR